MVTVRRPRMLLLAVVAALALTLTGCIAPGTPQVTATPGPSPTGPDFTRPGAAQAMVARLLAAAGNQQALMVEIAATTVQVSVLDADDRPITWAYRDGKIKEVHSDLAYVDQATFSIADFNISDVGGLFRAAAGQSGSEQNQSLTIVDYSGGEVMMSVSTVPESRTVFFTPSGALLELLNFDTAGGISTGIEQAIGHRTLVQSVTVSSDQGVWVDFPGTDEGTTVRRTRTSMVPVTTNVRAEAVDLPQFSADRINPTAIWTVLDSIRGSDDIDEAAPWSVIIDDRDRTSAPRMHFTISNKVVVTDLSGTVISG